MRRRISPDPIGIGDGGNVYCYVSCNPLSFVDPDGKMMEGAGGPRSPDNDTWHASVKTNFPQITKEKEDYFYLPRPVEGTSYEVAYATYKYHDAILTEHYGMTYQEHGVQVANHLGYGEFVTNPINKRGGTEKLEIFTIGNRTQEDQVNIMRHLFESVYLELQLSEMLMLNVTVQAFVLTEFRGQFTRTDPEEGTQRPEALDSRPQRPEGDWVGATGHSDVFSGDWFEWCYVGNTETAVDQEHRLSTRENASYRSEISPRDCPK